MLVDILLVVGKALLVLLYQLSHAFCPHQSPLVALGVNQDVCDVDDACKGLTIGRWRGLPTDVAEVHLVGTLQHVGSCGVFIVEVGSAATGEDQQVGVVAGGVAMEFLQSVEDGERRVHGGCIFCVTTELAGQVTGRFGIVH